MGRYVGRDNRAVVSRFRTKKRKWFTTTTYAPKQLAGATHYQETIRACRVGMPAQLVREPNNPHDPNAIAVFVNRQKVGYFARDVAEWAAKNIDSGRVRYKSVVEEVWSFVGDDDQEIYLISVTMQVQESREVEVLSPVRIIAVGIVELLRLPVRFVKWVNWSSVLRFLGAVGRQLRRATQRIDGWLLSVAGRDRWLHWTFRFIAMVGVCVAFLFVLSLL